MGKACKVTTQDTSLYFGYKGFGTLANFFSSYVFYFLVRSFTPGCLDYLAQ